MSDSGARYDDVRHRLFVWVDATEEDELVYMFGKAEHESEIGAVCPELVAATEQERVGIDREAQDGL